MNGNLLRRTFTDRRISLLVYALGIAAYAVLILGIWPSLRGSADTLNQLWNSYPESIRQAFGGENFTFSTFNGFISVEFLKQVWVIVMIAFVVSIATGALAGEVENGTMELLLAQPIKRRAIVITRHFYMSVGILALILASIIPIAVGAPFVQGDLRYGGLFAMIIPAFLFFTAIGSISLLFSAVASSRGRAIFSSVGLLIFFYAFDIIARLNDTVGKVHFLTIFDYWDPYRYLNDVSFAGGDIIIMAVVILVTTAAAVTWFEKRDIAV